MSIYEGREPTEDRYLDGNLHPDRLDLVLSHDLGTDEGLAAFGSYLDRAFRSHARAMAEEAQAQRQAWRIERTLRARRRQARLMSDLRQDIAQGRQPGGRGFKSTRHRWLARGICRAFLRLDAVLSEA